MLIGPLDTPASSSNRAQARYGSVAQAIHWLTAVLVLVAFIYGPGGSEQRVYATSSDADRHLHETLGLLVFALAFLRVMWRAVHRRPDPPAVPRWMGVLAKTVQALLFLLLFALPITAISGAWLEGHPLTLLSGVTVEPLLASHHDLGQTLATVHGWLGDVLMWLAGVHALAALYHHWILGDGVLVSMLPAWLRLRPKRVG